MARILAALLAQRYVKCYEAKMWAAAESSSVTSSPFDMDRLRHISLIRERYYRTWDNGTSWQVCHRYGHEAASHVRVSCVVLLTFDTPSHAVCSSQWSCPVCCRGCASVSVGLGVSEPISGSPRGAHHCPSACTCKRHCLDQGSLGGNLCVLLGAYMSTACQQFRDEM